MRPQNGVFETGPEGGLVYKYTNELETSFALEYVEFTAPRVTKLTATVDGKKVAAAWAGGGGAHSWWTAAGGRFLRYPLKPGQTLRIELSDEGAVRLDWYD